MKLTTWRRLLPGEERKNLVKYSGEPGQRKVVEVDCCCGETDALWAKGIITLLDDSDVAEEEFGVFLNFYDDNKQGDLIAPGPNGYYINNCPMCGKKFELIKVKANEIDS